MTPPLVAATDLAGHSGITYRQVDYWTRRGYIHPVTPAPGSGRERQFTAAETAVAQRMGALVEAGLTVPTAAAIARGDYAVLGALLRTVALVVCDLPHEQGAGT